MGIKTPLKMLIPTSLGAVTMYEHIMGVEKRYLFRD